MPIEVRILPDCVTIASYPGPDGSVNLEDLQAGRSATRRYRNRRIGEFLKELNLTEGRGTGIPKILRAIQKNGSPMPVFETDDDRTYFVARFPIHPGALQRIIKEDRCAPKEPGTKLAPSRDQVRIGASGNFESSEPLQRRPKIDGSHGGIFLVRPNKIPEEIPESSNRRGTSRNDHSRQAPELAPEVSADGKGNGMAGSSKVIKAAHRK